MMSNIVSALNLMNLNTTGYTFIKLDEQKTHLIKSEYFNYDQKEYHHKNYSINSYNKI